MSDRISMTHVAWLFAVASGFATAARAVEPSVMATSSTGDSLSISDPGAPPKEAAASVEPRSSFERAFRRGWPSSAELDLAPESSFVTPGPLDALGPRAFANEFSPKLATAPDPGEQPEIPNHPALTDAFFLGLGFFAATSNTEARLDSSTGLGTNVDMEDLMGLDENDVVPQGLARWRFTERWRLELEYFALNRSNTKAITGEIVWGDETFPINTTVDAKFDISVMRLSCGYSFFKRQDKELGVALGFHVTDIEASLSASGSTEDGGQLLAPLPVASVYGQCALTDTWAVAGRLDAFKLEYDAYSGHVFSLGIDALCQPWRHFGFGFGWRSLDIEAAIENSDWRGEVGTNYQGPIVFASLSF